jgi:hypothetical protein
MHAKQRAPPLSLHAHPGSLCPQCTAYARGRASVTTRPPMRAVPPHATHGGVYTHPWFVCCPAHRAGGRGYHPGSGHPLACSLGAQTGGPLLFSTPPFLVCMMPKPRQQWEGGTSREGGGVCGPLSHPRLRVAICHPL